MNKARIHKLAWGLSTAALGAVALTACQTAPRSERRAPAFAAANPKLVALAQDDALEALGLYIRFHLLGKTESRIALDRVLTRPARLQYDHSSAITGLIVPLASSMFVGAVVAGVRDDNAPFFNKYSFRFSGIGALAGSATIVTVAYSTDEYRKAISPRSDGSSFAERESNSFGYLQSSLRPDVADRKDEAEVDAFNLTEKAKFLADLKKTAIETARRTALMLGLNAMQTSELEFGIEEKLREAFKADRNWRAGEEIAIDVQATINKILPARDERLQTLGIILDAALKEKSVAPETNADLHEWFQGTASEMRKLETESVTAYRRLREMDDPKVGALTRRYQELGNALDAFAKRLKLHAELARAAKEK